LNLEGPWSTGEAVDCFASVVGLFGEDTLVPLDIELYRLAYQQS
jgi:hypothetical protein